MQILINFFVFLFVYALGNRLVAIPTGLALGLNQFLVVGIVIILDAVQVPVFFTLLEEGQNRFRALRFLFKILPSKEWVEHSFLENIIEHFGRISVMFIAALPALGGMWNAVLVSHLLQLNKEKTFIYLVAGGGGGTLLVWFGLATNLLLLRSLLHGFSPFGFAVVEE